VLSIFAYFTAKNFARFPPSSIQNLSENFQYFCLNFYSYECLFSPCFPQRAVLPLERNKKSPENTAFQGLFCLNSLPAKGLEHLSATTLEGFTFSKTETQK